MSRNKETEDPKCDVSTNRIIIDYLDPAAINSKYDFFRLIYSSKGSSFLIRAADEILFENNICAVRYMQFDKKGDTRSLFLMMTRSDSNFSNLNEYIKKYGDEYCSIRKYLIEDLMRDWKRETVQLLLNSTKWNDIENYRFNNVIGRYFCTNRTWFRGKRGFMALELKLNKEIICGEDSMVLSPELVPFTRYKDAPDNRKWPKSGDPQFKVKDDYSIERAFKKNDNNYISRQIPGKRNSLKYLSLDNPKSFYKSKVYIILKAVDMFNLTFDGMMHISFDHWVQVKHECITNKSIELFNKLLHERMEQRNFSIFDPVLDEDSQRCLNDIVSLFKTEFEIDLNIAHGPVNNHLNLSIIHDRDYYKRNKIDDHYNFYDGQIVHHVTIEKFLKDDDKNRSEASKKMLIKVIAKELFVKEDVMRRCITIDGWSERGYPEDVTFATLYVDEEADHEKRTSCRMTVHQDGSFDIDCIDENASCNDGLSLALFDAADQWGENNVEGAIMDGSGNINVICKTEIVTVPEHDIIDRVKKNDIEGTKSIGLRDYFSKNYIIHGNLDIRALRAGTEMYYFGGDLGDTPNRSTNAPNIRRIVPTDGSEVFFDEILELMNVPFVKYNSVTILPYPFKYLNEYVTMDKKKRRS